MRLEKLNNKAVWLAIVSFVALLGKTYGIYEVPDNFDVLTNAVLSILTALGILVDGKVE